jgi:hypothetical protein
MKECTTLQLQGLGPQASAAGCPQQALRDGARERVGHGIRLKRDDDANRLGRVLGGCQGGERHRQQHTDGDQHATGWIQGLRRGKLGSSESAACDRAAIV